MPNEADTCRRYVVPKLQAAEWDDEPHRLNEQVTFTDGRIVVVGRRGRRRPGKRADYLLRYRPDLPIAVVEAKPSYATPAAGLQQAKDYAEVLGLKFELDNSAAIGCGPSKLRDLQRQSAAELDALLLSIFDRAFKGKLS